MAKSKTKTVFICQECGSESPKWLGRCTSCGAWNSMVEEVVQVKKKGVSPQIGNDREEPSKPKPIDHVDTKPKDRIKVPDDEMDRVLGGGVVPGSMVLFGGEPGVGKSTLMLQFALLSNNLRTLYVSGEESDQQIRLRAERLGNIHENCLVYNETLLQNILQQAETISPDLIVIDSIQTLYSSDLDSVPGSVPQIRECAMELMGYAKRTGVPVFLIGHINKEGGLAGPKVLEHMVDTVLQFEGDRDHTYRLLRTSKNRFGSTHELGIYEMIGSGLRAVKDPSEVLISETDDDLSGVAIAATVEGVRPLLIEVQALVSSAVYGTPQRSSTGFDLRRSHMLLAVLEKRCGFRLGAKDVFLNITGGIKVDDPAIDLAVVCAVLSSSEDKPIPARICFSAEVGLSGEIRPVQRIDQRISEAGKLGFEKIVVSKYCKGLEKADGNIEVVRVSKIEEVYDLLFS